MTLLSAFNPHELPESRLRAVATGRTVELQEIIGTIRENLEGKTMQHIIVSAPRGFGKSFLMRHVELECGRVPRSSDRELAVVLMPEEMPHVKEPETLLREIARTFAGGRGQDAELSWHEDDGEAWDAAVKALDEAAASKLGGSGLLVALVENFDVLLKRAFASEAQRLRLRNWLTRHDTRIMLVAASSSGAFDRSYDEPLFHAFKEVALAPWSEDDCLNYFDRQRADAGKSPLSELSAARARAVASFIGGTPRLATLLGDALFEDDMLRAADLLDRLTDELTPYYKDRIDALPGRSQKLLDALLRFGEPATQSELARRVNANSQSAIAGPFADLVRERIVVGEKSPNSAAVLYRVADRIFAHYYRRRVVDHGEGMCPLEGLVDLLAQYYSRDEKRDRIEQFANLGRYEEARVMARLHDVDAGTNSRSREWMLRSLGEYQIPSRLLPYASPALQSVLQKIAALSVSFDGDGALKALNQSVGLVTQQEDLVLVELVRSALDAADGVAGGLSAAKKGLSLASGHPQLLPVALICMSWSQGQLGRHEEAVSTGIRAAALAESASAVRMQAAALRQVAFNLGQLGRNEEAVATAIRSAALADKSRDVVEQAEALRLLAFSLGQLGRNEEAVSTGTRAAAVAETAGDVIEQAIALSDVAFHLGQLGRHEEAVSIGTRAAALADTAGGVREQATALYHVAVSLGELGRKEQALATGIRAAVLAETTTDVTMEAAALRHVAFSLSQLSRHEEAVASATRAVALATKAAYVPELGQANGDLAYYLARCGRFADAVQAWLAAESSCAFDRSPDWASMRRAQLAQLLSGSSAGDIAAAHEWLAVLAQLDEGDPASKWAERFVYSIAQSWALRVTEPDRLTAIIDALQIHGGDLYSDARALLSACRNYHSAGRDPAVLANVDPDVAQTIMKVHPPA